MNIETDLIATSWITWEMCDLLTKAESLFGGRDPAFEFAGVAFSSEGPQTRFSPCGTRHLPASAPIGLALRCELLRETLV